MIAKTLLTSGVWHDCRYLIMTYGIDVPSNFLSMCIQVIYLCNILPCLVCIWNNMCEMCANTFLEANFLCIPSLLCALV